MGTRPCLVSTSPRTKACVSSKLRNLRKPRLGLSGIGALIRPVCWKRDRSSTGTSGQSFGGNAYFDWTDVGFRRGSANDKRETPNSTRRQIEKSIMSDTIMSNQRHWYITEVNRGYARAKIACRASLGRRSGIPVFAWPWGGVFGQRNVKGMPRVAVLCQTQMKGLVWKGFRNCLAPIEMVPMNAPSGNDHARRLCPCLQNRVILWSAGVFCLFEIFGFRGAKGKKICNHDGAKPHAPRACFAPGHGRVVAEFIRRGRVQHHEQHGGQGIVPHTRQTVPIRRAR